MTRITPWTALGVVLVSLLIAPNARAGPPPPPPPSPGCRVCSGPPPPPTPVATLAPTVVPHQQVVSVTLSPTHVKRGHRAKLAIKAAHNDRVTMVLRYRVGKPATYRARIGGSGTLVRRWRVPQSAPTGKASVRIRVTGNSTNYGTTVAFAVVK
jgi:hypothetical protein